MAAAGAGPPDSERTLSLLPRSLPCCHVALPLPVLFAVRGGLVQLRPGFAIDGRPFVAEFYATDTERVRAAEQTRARCVAARLKGEGAAAFARWWEHELPAGQLRAANAATAVLLAEYTAVMDASLLYVAAGAQRGQSSTWALHWHLDRVRDTHFVYADELDLATISSLFDVAFDVPLRQWAKGDAALQSARLLLAQGLAALGTESGSVDARLSTATTIGTGEPHTLLRLHYTALPDTGPWSHELHTLRLEAAAYERRARDLPNVTWDDWLAILSDTRAAFTATVATLTEAVVRGLQLQQLAEADESLPPPAAWERSSLQHTATHLVLALHSTTRSRTLVPVCDAHGTEQWLVSVGHRAPSELLLELPASGAGDTDAGLPVHISMLPDAQRWRITQVVALP